jgi:hypothetical protein
MGRKTTVAGCWWLTPVILASREAEIRRIEVQSQHQVNSSQDPILKKPNTKNRAGGVAQVVVYLPSKCEALSSNPSIRKKKKKDYLNHTSEASRVGHLIQAWPLPQCSLLARRLIASGVDKSPQINKSIKPSTNARR